MDEVMKAAIALLESGDRTGCDTLIVCDNEPYLQLQRAVHNVTGVTYGETSDE